MGRTTRSVLVGALVLALSAHTHVCTASAGRGSISADVQAQFRNGVYSEGLGHASDRMHVIPTLVPASAQAVPHGRAHGRGLGRKGKEKETAPTNYTVTFVHVPRSGGTALAYFLETCVPPVQHNSCPSHLDDSKCPQHGYNGRKHGGLNFTSPHRVFTILRYVSTTCKQANYRSSIRRVISRLVSQLTAPQNPYGPHHERGAAGPTTMPLAPPT